MPASLTQRYERMAASLGIRTTLHKLRHYSATELIAAGVDVRTIAGRLGQSGGSATTLRVYAAWVSEADQRAARSLAGRMPPRPRHQALRTSTRLRPHRRQRKPRTGPHGPMRALAPPNADTSDEAVPAGSRPILLLVGLDQFLRPLQSIIDSRPVICHLLPSSCHLL